jgi:hypothetical protein
LTLADGKLISYGDGWIREELANVCLKIENHYEELIELDIIDIKYDIVLGIDWLQEYNPTIDWKTRTLIFPEYSRGQRSGKPRLTSFAKAI